MASLRIGRWVTAVAVALCGIALGGVAWSNPHHAYILFVEPGSLIPYVQEVSVDPRPGPTLTLQGSNTGFCEISAFAIGPQGNLYVSGYFGSNCQSAFTGIEVFAPGANGNAAPIATLAGTRTLLQIPNGMAFDSSGRLYVTQSNGAGHGGAQIDIFAAGASGNVAPVGVIVGRNTQLGGKRLSYVAVDEAGEIFAAGGAGRSSILTFPAGANGNVAPVATKQIQSRNGFFELQASGNTVYAAVGVLKETIPTVYELSASNLAQIGAITDHRFAILHADVDASGKVYVQDVNRTGNDSLRMRLFEYEPGQQQPSRVRSDGVSEGGGYVVLGP